jgi:hypothetical protein
VERERERERGNTCRREEASYVTGTAISEPIELKYLNFNC